VKRTKVADRQYITDDAILILGADAASGKWTSLREGQTFLGRTRRHSFEQRLRDGYDLADTGRIHVGGRDGCLGGGRLGTLVPGTSTPETTNDQQTTHL